MKRTTATIMTVLCIIVTLPVTGSASSNQNLEWGVQVGEQFDYRYQYVDYYEPNNSKDLDCYIVVESLPLIPDDISDVFSPLFFHLNLTVGLRCYFVNGTVAVIILSMGLPQMILPVGNWSLWSDLLEDYEASSFSYYDSINTTETSTSWTWKRFTQYDDTDLRGHAATAIFRKSDGVVSYYQYVGFDYLGDKYFEYKIVRSDYITGINPYFVIPVVVVAVIAVAIVYKMKKGSKTV